MEAACIEEKQEKREREKNEVIVEGRQRMLGHILEKKKTANMKA